MRGPKHLSKNIYSIHIFTEGWRGSTASFRRQDMELMVLLVMTMSFHIHTYSLAVYSHLVGNACLLRGYV